MQITISDFSDTAKKVTLIGKLDIAGAETIGLPMAAIAGTRTDIVIDMVGVEFIASIGIRHLVIAAKAVARGAGKLVLLDPSPVVTEVLLVSGLEQILPIVRSEDDARAMLRRSPVNYYRPRSCPRKPACRLSAQRHILL
jgi:anti-sigma B factor antagonist